MIKKRLLLIPLLSLLLLLFKGNVPHNVGQIISKSKEKIILSASPNFKEISQQNFSASSPNVCQELNSKKDLTDLAKSIIDKLFQDAKLSKEKINYDLAWENHHFKTKDNEVFIFQKKKNDFKKIENFLFKEDRQNYPEKASSQDHARFSQLENERKLVKIYSDHVYSLVGKNSLVSVNEENGRVVELAFQDPKFQIYCDLHADNKYQCECLSQKN